ncbi:MAG TPA: aminotransferase class I/II-fold pyridoxal phosphate-dependent enzyme [Epsilonproteobacteria bacterium]|nr:aminotransferase class I/II-fold pyridoxal phosphate-dependent enzyme [Campylobacterota bacterium]
MTTFQHGGDVTAFAKACGCKVDEVIDLSSNINFVKPAIDVDFNTLNIAPYPNYDALYIAVAKHYGVGVGEMELFNGGSSAIFSLFSHLKVAIATAPYVSIYSPAYLEYKKAAERFGYDLNIVNRFDALHADVPEGSLVIFVNPSTPDGMLYQIDDLLTMWQKKNCTVLIDESFIEFSDAKSVTHTLSKYPNLYILKSMTKFFGAAGIRVGTLISQAKNIKILREKEPLWKLSAFDAAYIQAVLRDSGFKTRSDDANAKSKAYLTQVLQKSSLVEKIYPSSANYLLVKLTITAKTLQEKLLPYKVMIRSCENFDGLSDYHARIAVKSMKDLTLFAKALDA